MSGQDESPHNDYELTPGGGKDQKAHSLNLLFFGFDNPRMDQIISLLRSAHILVRAESTNDVQSLSSLVGKRLWDVLLCIDDKKQHQQIQQILTLLHTQERDLPTVVLSENTSTENTLKALQSGIAALMPLTPDELLIEILLQQARALNTRRQLRQITASYENLELNYQKLIEHSGLACCYVREDTILHANHAFYRLLGFDLDTPLTLGRFLSAEERDKVMPFIVQQRSSDLYMSMQLYPLKQEPIKVRTHIVQSELDGTPCSILLFNHSDPNNKESRDLETGLPNNQALIENLHHQLQSALEGGHDTYLLYIHLHDLKDYPQDTRKKYIQALTHTLSRLQETDQLYRASSDGLAILYQNPSSNDAKALAEKISALIKDAVIHVGEDRKSIISRSGIGIGTLHDSSGPAWKILARTQQCAADCTPDAPYCLCQNTRQLPHAKQYADHHQSILRAIEKGHVSLLYQPVLALDETMQLPYYEVFIHLLDENGKVLPPARFISALENTRMITQLDCAVVAHAAKQLLREKRRGHHNYLFINLCGRSVASEELRKTITEQLKNEELDADQFIFQISEADAALWLGESAEFTEFCHQLGVRVCLKHFGSSSRTKEVLTVLPADFFKVDGARVKEMQDGIMTPEDLKAFLKPIASRSVPIIAPLVESTRIISQLFRCGVTLIQGYYIREPSANMDYNSFVSH